MTNRRSTGIKIRYKRPTKVIYVDVNGRLMAFSDLGKIVQEPDPKYPSDIKVHRFCGLRTNPEPGREPTYTEIRAFKKQILGRGAPKPRFIDCG